MRKPLFREQMIRIKLDKWTLRFWFNIKLMAPRQPIVLERVKVIRERCAIETSPDQIEFIIMNTFDDADGLSAIEILHNSNMCGIISYFEWP